MDNITLEIYSKALCLYRPTAGRIAAAPGDGDDVRESVGGRFPRYEGAGE